MKKKLCMYAMGMLMTVCCLQKTADMNLVKAAEIEYDYTVTDKEYGAKGTDKKSDALAIQAALDEAIGAKEQVTVYIPEGTYYIDRMLKIYSNTHLILDENAVIYRMDSILAHNLIGNADQNGERTVKGGYNMSKNITIEGGVWDGGNIEKAKEASDVMRIDHAQNVVIKNCTIKNVYDCHLLEITATKDAVVSGCTFTGFRYMKGKENKWLMAREAVQIEGAWTNNPKNLKDEDSYWVKGVKIDGTGCDNIQVVNNSFIDMPSAVGQHHYSDGNGTNTNITISNNTIKISNAWKYCKSAITCVSMDQIEIANNTITGPYRFGIHIQESNGVVVKNNSISGTQKIAVLVTSGNVKSIESNTIKNVKQHGISVLAGKITKIDNNNISDIKSNGISVTNGKIDSITNNNISKTTKNAISIAKGTIGKEKKTNTGIQNNTITSVKAHGICVSDGTVFHISNNKISKISKNGILVLKGTIGKGKKTTTGIQNNKVTSAKAHGICVTGGTVSVINKNTVKKSGKNGVSIAHPAKVYRITKNKLIKSKANPIWNGSTAVKTVMKKNKTK